MSSITAEACATVANLGVGFDILGLCLEAPKDRVTLTKASGKGVRIIETTGVTTTPMDLKLNTATEALRHFLSENPLGFGLEVKIQKGIPLSSGLGGSAASAVAAVVAANEFLESKLSREKLFVYALTGESVASGARHGDNVAPCLFGGIQLLKFKDDVIKSHSLNYPKSLECVVVHPHIEIKTKESRKKLKKEVLLTDHVKQSANLALFISSLHLNDLSLTKEALNDLIIEPQRKSDIKGFDQAKKAAFEKGCVGFSISGSGPTVFALSRSENSKDIAKAIVGAFEKVKLPTDVWISPINSSGARVVR